MYSKIIDTRLELKSVNPIIRKKGIGRVVLSMLIEELFRMGANAIFLDTNLKNTRAQHVYEKTWIPQNGSSSRFVEKPDR